MVLEGFSGRVFNAPISAFFIIANYFKRIFLKLIY